MRQKSLLLTYVFWLFGGIFGLHHFYLKRDYHALVWCMTLGGYFGIGWFRDLWRIPEYVSDANEDPAYLSQLASKMLNEEKPHSGFIRQFGMLFVGDTLGMLVMLAVPGNFAKNYFGRFIISLLVPCSTSLGVYLVGNIGRHKGSLKAPLIAAYLTTPLYLIMDAPLALSSIFASYAFNSKSKQWRRTPRPEKSCFRRAMFFILCGSLYLLLWSSWFFFNCKIDHSNEEVMCVKAAKNFFASPVWKDVALVLKKLWEIFITEGWQEVWKELISAFDFDGEAHAIGVLGLKSDSIQQEITARYRKLSREWHPDKHKDPEAKKFAQKKFIEIQEAYETLSQIKSKRLKKNIEDPIENSKHSEM